MDSLKEGAAAIKYRSGNQAPFLICKGKGEMAKKLLEMADIMDIPIQSNPDLLEELLVLNPGSFIPEELFEVVAEILSFVYAQESGK